MLLAYLTPRARLKLVMYMVGVGIPAGVSSYQQNPENGLVVPILMGIGVAFANGVAFLDKAVSEKVDPVEEPSTDEGA